MNSNQYRGNSCGQYPSSAASAHPRRRGLKFLPILRFVLRGRPMQLKTRWAIIASTAAVGAAACILDRHIAPDDEDISHVIARTSAANALSAVVTFAVNGIDSARVEYSAPGE